MSEKEWDKFFDLLMKIINQDGTWTEKWREVLVAARERNCEGDLEEFCGWFQSEE